MAKSTFNLQATNTAFSSRETGATAQPRADRAIHSGGPHFGLTSSDPTSVSPGRPSSAAAAAGGRSIGLRAFSVTAVIATMLVAAFWLSRPWQRQTLAQRWRHDLHEADDAIALARVHQLGQLGPPGVRVLGGAVGIAREDVARSARAEVVSLLAKWELIEAKRSSPLVVALVQGMAESIDAFDREARRFAGDMAQRILVWPIERSTTNRAPLIAACETVLLAVGRPAVPPAAPKPAAQPTRAAEPTPTEPTPAEARLLPSSVDVRPLPRVPAEELTVEVSDSEASEPPPATGDAEPAEPAPTDKQDKAQPAPRKLSRAVTDLQQGERAIDEATDNSPSGFSSQQAALIRDLNSEQDEVVAQASAELAKLGLGPDELKVARLSTHPDATVRKKLARVLPRLPGIDARTWLEFLTDDPDEEVRRTAQTLLATTGDAARTSRLSERR